MGINPAEDQTCESTTGVNYDMCCDFTLFFYNYTDTRTLYFYIIVYIFQKKTSPWNDARRNVKNV